LERHSPDGEGFGFTVLHPGYLAEAEEAKDCAAAGSFELAMDVKRVHSDLSAGR
jgi:hypothetical protein